MQIEKLRDLMAFFRGYTESVSRHLSDDEFINYITGTMPADAVEKVKKHLGVCFDCLEEAEKQATAYEAWRGESGSDRLASLRANILNPSLSHESHLTSEKNIQEVLHLIEGYRVTKAPRIQKTGFLDFEMEQTGPAVIRVIGVGGAGGNAINTMIDANVTGVEFIAVNTDIQDLRKCKAPEKIQIGAELTRGLGAGSNPQKGQQAADADRDRLKGLVEGADMVFITCGLGGGTGTGASPVIAELAMESNILTVAVVTKPFDFEASVRVAQAETGAKELKKVVDALITIPNDKLLEVADKNMTLIEAFERANDVLRQGVQSISDLITQEGLLNVDFADVETVMFNTGSALMGIGVDAGDNRAVRAVEKAISSPLLEEASIYGARSVLVTFSGNSYLGIHEINDAMAPIRDAIDPDANLIFGMVIDESLEDKIKVTVIATGFDAARYDDNELMSGYKALDLDTILSENFDRPTFIRRRRPPTRNGVSNELDIPTFLRVRKRET